MTRIDLALHGAPIRTPLAKAARRNAKIWLCLSLIALDAVALAFGFAVTLIIEAPRSISDGLLTAMVGALRPPKIFGQTVRCSSSTNPARNKAPFSSPPPSQSRRFTPHFSRNQRRAT